MPPWCRRGGTEPPTRPPAFGGLRPNTEVTFDLVNGEARLWKANANGGKRSRGDGVVQRLRSVRPSNKLTTDEIMALMRGNR